MNGVQAIRLTVKIFGMVHILEEGNVALELFISFIILKLVDAIFRTPMQNRGVETLLSGRNNLIGPPYTLNNISTPQEKAGKSASFYLEAEYKRLVNDDRFCSSFL